MVMRVTCLLIYVSDIKRLYRWIHTNIFVVIRLTAGCLFASVTVSNSDASVCWPHPLEPYYITAVYNRISPLNWSVLCVKSTAWHTWAFYYFMSISKCVSFLRSLRFFGILLNCESHFTMTLLWSTFKMLSQSQSWIQLNQVYIYIYTHIYLFYVFK